MGLNEDGLRMNKPNRAKKGGSERGWSCEGEMESKTPAFVPWIRLHHHFKTNGVLDAGSIKFSCYRFCHS